LQQADNYSGLGISIVNVVMLGFEREVGFALFQSKKYVHG